MEGNKKKVESADLEDINKSENPSGAANRDIIIR